MRKIALVTDSTCDMPEAELLRHHPVTVPLHFALDGVDYLDGVDMDHKTFYQRFRDSGQEAHSSQPSAGDFARVYEPLLAEYDAVVSVHISHRLSGVMESAALAAETIGGDRVRLVDSKHVSVGLGLVVRTAGEAIEAGADLDTVVAAAEAAAQATRVYGAVFDLAVAVKGGRISAPAATLAGMMSLKPLIVFDKDGAAHIAGARLGQRKALQGIVNKVLDFSAGHVVRVVVVHADGLEAAQTVQAQLAAQLPGQDIPVVEAGPVITTHVGLGTVAVAVQRAPLRM